MSGQETVVCSRGCQHTQTPQPPPGCSMMEGRITCGGRTATHRYLHFICISIFNMLEGERNGVVLQAGPFALCKRYGLQD